MADTLTTMPRSNLCRLRAIKICATWRIVSVPLPWTRFRMPIADIPVCRWAWRISRPCCSRDFCSLIRRDPHWLDRDRFVISNGHGSMLLYGLLYLTGYKDMTIDDLKQFRQIDSKTPGHPEDRHADGIETTTGPLGQGLANSAGLALAERIMNARFGDDTGQPLHLCVHGRWLPDGGHQP